MGFSDIRKLCKIKGIQLRRIELENQLRPNEENYPSRDQIQRTMLYLLQAIRSSVDNVRKKYPELSSEKQSALGFINKGFSYRETALRIRKNHTIITQWKKNDPKFKQALEEAERETQESQLVEAILEQLSFKEKTSTSQMNEELEDPSL